MEERNYYAEGSRCGECGSDLGRHQVWTLVFSDDPAEVVEQTLSGNINRVPCPTCRFEGAWLWPATFLFVDTREERAVCVTMSRAAGQQISLLRVALDTNEIRERGLDPERLLLRTKIVNDYKEIAGASKTPIEQVQQENHSILEYLERKDLSGESRVKRLVDAAINTGALNLELEELTPEFLKEVEKYQGTLTGQEDPRVAQCLDQLVAHLRARLTSTRKSLPRRDERTALAEVLKSNLTSTPRNLIGGMFDGHLEEGKAAAIQLRLLRLCSAQSEGPLRSVNALPIDFRPELLNLANQLIDGQGLESTVLSENHFRELPQVRDFLSTLKAIAPPKGLPEAPPHFTGPAPSWLAQAEGVLEEIVKAMGFGVIPMEVFDPIAEQPVAQAYVHTELGRMLVEQDHASGAMNEFLKALKLIEGVSANTTSPSDYATTRLHAVCLERLGNLQLQYGRLEESIELMQAARSLYEQIGATDGVLHSLRDEGSIWLNLGRTSQAEGLFMTIVRSSEGCSTANEVRDLMNAANVYRYLRSWLSVDLDYGRQQPEGTGATVPEDDLKPTLGEGVPSPEAPFEQKGGILVSISVEGHDELSMRELLGSEQMRLLYRALAVATLNDDTTFVKQVMGRIVVVYGEQGCNELATYILDRILENSTLENAGLDAQFYAFNRLGRIAVSREDAGEAESAAATRSEQLQVMEFILAGDDKLPVLVMDEMRGEKACLLESLDRPEDARDEYNETIRKLEKSRSWMRDPENKRGLQSRRWRPYVRAARNSLRMYTKDRTRIDLLIEAWNGIQAGRSRAMLDAIAAEQTDDITEAGVVSVRPVTFKEVSARLSKDMLVLEYVLMPSSPGCPGSWSLFAVEPDADAPWLVWQEPDMDRVYEAQQKLSGVADEFEKTVLEDGFLSITRNLEEKYTSALEVLADILFPQGLLDQLSARGYRRLVIVADAYLHEVPFAALRPMQLDERNYLGLPRATGGFQIVSAPSSSIFGFWNSRASRRKSGAQGRASLFIDPLGDLSNLNPAVMETLSVIETRLRDRQVEVTRLDGNGATPAAWLSQSRGRDLVVYFGHSIAGPQDGERAALTLSDGSNSVAPVTAEDIYRTSTRPLFSRHSLFILASCSGGTVYPGGWDSDRELRGLSTAHLYAGCAAVIAASRPLLDSPTLVLLDMLVSEILSGHDGASSLAQAQLKLAASKSPFAHPHFWGYVGLMGVPGWSLGI